jgi:pyruvate ferredoxin oxidoreductase alpha subunit
MTRALLTGNKAAAWGARLASIDYIPFFPITPQTEIMETIAQWIDDREIQARLTTLESEHSMIAAAGAAAAAGARVFTATSSQGLLYGMEMIYTVAGWRVPFVLVNVSRGLSAPITLEPDHNDIMAARDSGFVQIFCSTCQEVLDHVLMAYRLAEDERVRLPVMVNMEGFYLSFTREPVHIPTSDQAKSFVRPHDPDNIGFRAGSPLSQGVAVLGGTLYSYFRYQSHLASLNSLAVYEQAAQEFKHMFHREYAPVETYRVDDAEIVLVILGCFATKAKAAVDGMRSKGTRVGLVRPRIFRPFPHEAVRKVLTGKQCAAVIDQNISLGKGGIMFSEIASALIGHKDVPLLASFICGLGGRDIKAEEFEEMVRVCRETIAWGRPPEPRLLFTRAEMDQIRKLQDIALGPQRRAREEP